jgi:hypothetical protein
MPLVFIEKWTPIKRKSTIEHLVVVGKASRDQHEAETYTVSPWNIKKDLTTGLTMIDGTLIKIGERKADKFTTVKLCWSMRSKPKPIDFQMMSWEDQYELTEEQYQKSEKAKRMGKRDDSKDAITKEDVLNMRNYLAGYY